jgi:hypothetical protein
MAMIQAKNQKLQKELDKISAAKVAHGAQTHLNDSLD